MASGSLSRTPSEAWLDGGEGASAQDSDSPADVEAGVGNIRAALGHQHGGNPGGWEDTTGA